MNLLRIAIDLHEVNHDPLLFDAIRVLTTRGAPSPIVASAQAFVEHQLENYLNFFGNSDRYVDHGYDSPRGVRPRNS